MRFAFPFPGKEEHAEREEAMASDGAAKTRWAAKIIRPAGQPSA